MICLTCNMSDKGLNYFFDKAQRQTEKFLWLKKINAF